MLELEFIFNMSIGNQFPVNTIDLAYPVPALYDQNAIPDSKSLERKGRHWG